MFTNLTRDHLDFHHTMEEYFAAKQLLFTGSGGPPPRYSIINRDDEWGRKLNTGGSEVLWYGLGPDAGVRARHIRSAFAGLRFEVNCGTVKFEVTSPLIGKINVYNILAAIGAALSLDISVEKIEQGIRTLEQVPGRFQRIDEGQPFLVVVDYAHADDALRNLISTCLLYTSLTPRLSCSVCRVRSTISSA